jgi:presqualene diphosphate synthase
MSDGARRSSFYWAMRLMPQAQRGAMFAVYRLAHALDDVADGGDTAAERQAALSRWRREIDVLYAGIPDTSEGKFLLPFVSRFQLRREEFDELIKGLEMDVAEPIRAPAAHVLDLYCRRVAGTIGILVLPILGARDAMSHEFALYLGRALQLTNILRDLTEDAARGRLYVPREMLGAAGIETNEPALALNHPRFPEAAQHMVAEARRAFRAADTALIQCDRRKLWPALAMASVYRSLLERLAERPLPTPERLRHRKSTALIGALRALLFARG